MPSRLLGLHWLTVADLYRHVESFAVHSEVSCGMSTIFASYLALLVLRLLESLALTGLLVSSLQKSHVNRSRCLEADECGCAG